MRRMISVSLAVGLAMLCAAATASAQDSVIGTFTVAGKTTKFSNVYATLEASPANSSEKYLILLVSDVPIAPADRSPAKLTSLASTGAIHALKLRWKYGFDSIAVIPYHSGVQETGYAMASMSTINLSALSDDRVHAEFKAKMLGQTWFFNALIKAAIVKGGTATLEPDLDTTVTPSAGGGKTIPRRSSARSAAWATSSRPTRSSRRLATTRPKPSSCSSRRVCRRIRRTIRTATRSTTPCSSAGHAPAESAEVILALLAGKADVKTKDPDNGTTALVGSVQSCNLAAVEALIKAGSDFTAKSNGGTTALQLARILGRTDLVGGTGESWRQIGE